MMKMFFALAMTAVFSTTGYSQDKNLLETLKQSANYSTFAGLVETAGLQSLLTGTDKYTIFAPTNDAFEKVPAADLAALKKDPAALKKMIQYHIITSAIPSDQLLRLKTARTIEGARVEFMMKGGKSSVQEAEITQPNLKASNGIIHGVNAVLKLK